MERQTHVGAFLLVEGKTDKMRFGKFLDGVECVVINCTGKLNVICTVEILYDSGFEGALGMVDADFDTLIIVPKERDGLVVSEAHDFDMEVFLSPALEKYLIEVSDPEKVKKFESTDAIRKEIYRLSKPIAALKLANQKLKLGYRLDDIRHEDICDGHNVTVENLVDHISWGKFSNSNAKSYLRQSIYEELEKTYDSKLLICGHDACAILGIMLRSRLGSRKGTVTVRSEVEMHLRLSFEARDFKLTPTWRKIVEWEKNNYPYLILSGDVRAVD